MSFAAAHRRTMVRPQAVQAAPSANLGYRMLTTECSRDNVADVDPSILPERQRR
jgi:hypothetical protein